MCFDNLTLIQRAAYGTDFLVYKLLHGLTYLNRLAVCMNRPESVSGDSVEHSESQITHRDVKLLNIW